MEESKKSKVSKILFAIFAVIFIGCIIGLTIYGIREYRDRKAIEKQQAELTSQIEAVRAKAREMAKEGNEDFTIGVQGLLDQNYSEEELADLISSITTILPEYQDLYDINNYLIGWLKIDGTNVDYPVVQTPEDENMYLRKDFYGQPNNNGTLLLDTDSCAGLGRKQYDYMGGFAPSTNLIIHGHTMRSGAMFGKLKDYHSEDYCKEHSIIKFDSLYEQREYEVIAVFESKVFYSYETDVFKYYNFFQANTQEEFDDWYTNIKKMSLYDTGVEAEFGDEFITLSCCAYHTENGRFVVVGKRIK